MNIFILDNNPEKCAQYHCDRHVIKMILESAQMMCSVIWQQGDEAPYKNTHKSHPCTLWLHESLENWHWLKTMVTSLNEEYMYRYEHNKSHASFEVIKKLKTPILPDTPRTKFVQAMPDQYKNPLSAVKAYRGYYIGEKFSFCNWTKRKKPIWFNR